MSWPPLIEFLPVEFVLGRQHVLPAAGTVGSTTEEAIRSAGFDIIANPTRKLPNHHRIIHPDAAAGFTDENLVRLAGVFTNTTGH